MCRRCRKGLRSEQLECGRSGIEGVGLSSEQLVCGRCGGARPGLPPGGGVGVSPSGLPLDGEHEDLDDIVNLVGARVEGQEPSSSSKTSRSGDQDVQPPARPPTNFEARWARLEVLKRLLLLMTEDLVLKDLESLRASSRMSSASHASISCSFSSRSLSSSSSSARAAAAAARAAAISSAAFAATYSAAIRRAATRRPTCLRASWRLAMA